MEIVKYGINESAIAEMSNIYLDLSIDGIDDKDGYDDVHSARMVMVKHRTSIEKLRKNANKDAQGFINNNNKNAKRLLNAIAPIEEHLKSEENKIAQEEKRIQEEKERIEQEMVKKRVDALLNIEVIMPYTEIAAMTDDEYESLFKNAKKIFEDKKAKADEEKRLIAESEKRLAIERAEIERIRLEQEKISKAQADRNREIEEKKQSEIKQKEREELERILKEKAIIYAEKKAKEKIETYMQYRRIEIEKIRINDLLKIDSLVSRQDLGTMPADQFERIYNTEKEKYDKKQERIIAEKIEKERIEKEKAEAIEKKRIEETKPDKEKLLQYAKRLTSIIGPDLKNSSAISIILFAESELNTIAENIIKQSEKL